MELKSSRGCVNTEAIVKIEIQPAEVYKSMLIILKEDKSPWARWNASFFKRNG